MIIYVRENLFRVFIFKVINITLDVFIDKFLYFMICILKVYFLFMRYIKVDVFR